MDIIPPGIYDALLVFLLLNIGDFITTKSALEKGGYEANPIARIILKKLGMLGLWAFKLVLTGILPLIAWLTGQDVEQALWIWNILLGAVVAWNSYMNIRLRRKSKIKMV